MRKIVSKTQSRSNRKKEMMIAKDEHFRIVFDIYTQRPHLIMLSNNREYNSIYDFDNKMYKLWLNFLFRSFILLKECIFSIHLGFYQSKQSPHFHAHYFVPIYQYKQLCKLHNMKYNINMNKWKQTLIKDGIKYKKNDIDNIQDIKINSNLSLPTLPDGYHYHFHPNQPRIAIYHENAIKNNDYKTLIGLMLSFILYYELNDPKKGAAHLCIQHNMFIDDYFKTYSAYIQIDIINYYKINKKRNIWLKNFMNTDYVVIT